MVNQKLHAPHAPHLEMVLVGDLRRLDAGQAGGLHNHIRVWAALLHARRRIGLVRLSGVLRLVRLPGWEQGCMRNEVRGLWQTRVVKKVCQRMRRCGAWRKQRRAQRVPRSSPSGCTGRLNTVTVRPQCHPPPYTIEKPAIRAQDTILRASDQKLEVAPCPPQ